MGGDAVNANDSNDTASTVSKPAENPYIKNFPFFTNFRFGDSWGCVKAHLQYTLTVYIETYTKSVMYTYMYGLLPYV